MQLIVFVEVYIFLLFLLSETHTRLQQPLRHPSVWKAQKEKLASSKKLCPAMSCVPCSEQRPHVQILIADDLYFRLQTPVHPSICML